MGKTAMSGPTERHFARVARDQCALCGSRNALTGEHKIKAASLRSEFGSDQMVVRREEFGQHESRLAQGPKSKALHFEAKLCGTCNSRATQPADLAFDHLHDKVRRLVDLGRDPSEVFELPEFQPDQEDFLNAFRYFAKLLCCHLVDAGAPRPLHMSEFARGENDTNCVWLEIDRDWAFNKVMSRAGVTRYAAHGGLAIYGNSSDGGPNAFHSTRTVGAIRYIFFSRLTIFERDELERSYPDFWNSCRSKISEAAIEPVSIEDRLRLGLPIHIRAEADVLVDPDTT